MSTPVEGGRALLRGRVFGVPVHLDLSFVLVMALLGFFRTTAPTVTYMALWLVIATLAVLTHELGHAAAARAARADPHIALVGFGGVTTFTPPAPLSRARSLGISLAGPAVGLVLGGVAWLLLVTVGPSLQTSPWLEDNGWQFQALWITMWTCLGWSVLNLLPILPLDGGQAMRELLPGDEATRTRRAAMVSVIVAAAAALAAYLYGQHFIALFLVFFGISNLLALRQSADSQGGGDPSGSSGAADGPTTPEQSVVALLWRNDPAGARRLMESLPPDDSIDLAVHGAVLALTGDPQGGHALLDQELRRRPGDVDVAALLVLTQTLEHDWDALLATLYGPLGPAIPPPVVERAIAEAAGVGRDDVAGRITARHGSA